MSRRLKLLLALACGVMVANVYLPQPLTPVVAHDLRVPPSTAAWVVTAAQLGYAAGIFLLVPLCDRLGARRLVAVLAPATAAALACAALAPGIGPLVAASAAVGVATVVPQVLIPFAAGLVPAERRGATTGTLLAGLLGGVLLARTFSGTVGAALGWRATYAIAVGLALLVAVVLARALPDVAPATHDRYASLLAAPVRLLRDEPDLRASALYQATVFGAFSAAWTTLPLLLTGPHYSLTTTAVGLVALVGAASVLAAPWAGRRTDARGPDRVNAVATTTALASAGLLAGGHLGGAGGVVLLTTGMLVLDVATQAGQVANQSRIFAARPDARSRANTAYMTCAFLGGALGSWLGARAYDVGRWAAVCGLVAAYALVTMLALAARSAPRRARLSWRA